MNHITCSINANINPRITPDLPAGLTYSITKVSNTVTVTISGTPKEGLNPRLIYIGYNAWISTVEIAGTLRNVRIMRSVRQAHVLQLRFRRHDPVHRD